MSYWEAALEDSLDLTAKLPVIAAYIYRMKYFGESKKAEIQSQTGLWRELRADDESFR